MSESGLSPDPVLGRPGTPTRNGVCLCMLFPPRRLGSPRACFGPLRNPWLFSVLGWVPEVNDWHDNAAERSLTFPPKWCIAPHHGSDHSKQPRLRPGDPRLLLTAPRSVT